MHEVRLARHARDTHLGPVGATAVVAPSSLLGRLLEGHFAESELTQPESGGRVT
jgi:hypothetical protein